MSLGGSMHVVASTSTSSSENPKHFIPSSLMAFRKQSKGKLVRVFCIYVEPLWKAIFVEIPNERFKPRIQYDQVKGFSSFPYI